MIYIIWAPPREGKSFYATYLVLKELQKKNGKKCYTNYPVIYERPLSFFDKVKNIKRKIKNRLKSSLNVIETRKYRKYQYQEMIKPKIFSSYKWDSEYIYSGVRKSLVILDEAYNEGVNSREWVNFDKDKHLFFSTNGHNDLDIYLIAQNPARIDTVIREMCNYFIFVAKNCFPWSNEPLWFTVEYYLSIEDFQKRKSDEDKTWSRIRIGKSKDVMASYDTHWYRNENAEPNAETWAEIYNK
jgi:hypothetical protein